MLKTIQEWLHDYHATINPDLARILADIFPREVATAAEARAHVNQRLDAQIAWLDRVRPAPWAGEDGPPLHPQKDRPPVRRFTTSTVVDQTVVFPMYSGRVEDQAPSEYRGWRLWLAGGAYGYSHPDNSFDVFCMPDWEVDGTLTIQVGEGACFREEHDVRLVLPREGRTGRQIFELVQPTLDKLMTLSKGGGLVSANWFDVDRKGLAKLLERRGKIWLLHELVANAWDADGVTRVEVVIEPEEGAPLATVVVRDDAPEGFADMSHAWTLFGASSRKHQAQKRGRFNLGEKLVLALCNEASIISTRGAVLFDGRGRSNMKARRPRGTEFQGIARLTRAELSGIKQGLLRLIPPPDVKTLINGEELPGRVPIKTIEASLPTEVADDEGVLRRTTRKTAIRFFELLPGETAMLYEMGIPVVEIALKWHVDVQQKVPLNMVDRDNVTPAYLREILTLAVNALHERLTVDDANATFVNEALADEGASPEAVRHALDLKYGEKRAIWDPSDPEANMNLVARGYALIRGGQLTREQWQNVKQHDAAGTRPAGQIAPTRKAQFSPDGEDRWVPQAKWTPAMRSVVEYTTYVCRELLDAPVTVSILSDITAGYGACFGEQHFVYNLGRLGHAFFDACAHGPTNALNRLVIHEAGHGMPGGENHLAAEYHEGLCALGARLARLALTRPERFRW